MPALDAALNLARAGFRVFPLHGITGGCCSCGKHGCGSPGKHPAIAGWQKAATCEETKVRELFDHRPNANIGLATGQGLVVIDLDGAQGLATLAGWESEHGRLPETLRVQTGGGGLHLYFRTEEKLRNSVRLLGPGVDVRAEGGYVVGPGSHHVSGRDYTWLDRPAGGAAPLPTFILDRLRGSSEAAGSERVGDEGGALPGGSAPGDPIPEGSRNDALFRYGCDLRAKGHTIAQIDKALREMNAARCTPPLSREEVAAIRDSIDRFPRGKTAAEDFKPLEKAAFGSAVSAADLQTANLPPPVWTVDGLIIHGLTFLVAAPKAGKSWMVLDLAISTALGVPFWGRPVKKSTVFYYALEDSQNRLKSRMEPLLRRHGGFAPKKLFFRTKAPTILNGLGDVIRADHAASKGAENVLICIDTFQMCRDGSLNAREGAFATDYREANFFKKLADELKCSIIVVHHINKRQNVMDAMELISGTNGIAAAADTSMVITRKRRLDSDAILTVMGRDAENMELAIRFDKDELRWKMLGERDAVETMAAAERYQQDPIAQTIKALTATTSWVGTMEELATEIINRGGNLYAPAALGKAVRGLLPDLLARDAISCEEQATRKKRTMRFFRGAL